MVGPPCPFSVTTNDGCTSVCPVCCVDHVQGVYYSCLILAGWFRACALMMRDCWLLQELSANCALIVVVGGTSRAGCVLCQLSMEGRGALFNLKTVPVKTLKGSSKGCFPVYLLVRSVGYIGWLLGW